MRDELVGLVEDALGRKVIAFVSGNPSIPTSPATVQLQSRFCGGARARRPISGAKLQDIAYASPGGMKSGELKAP